MRDLVSRATLALLLALAGALCACSSSIDNGLEEVPPVAISESERIPLSASGAVGSEGLTLTDADSGAEVSIPGGTEFTLDASDSDDIEAVIPESIVVILRPISQFLATQNGDLLTTDGLNLPNLKKVG